MIEIEEYLQKIFEDFKQFAEDGNQLCSLKELHFQGGQVPDYFDIHLQQLYLLRYAFAYSFEYMEMFEDLLQKHPYENEIRILSVGCGANLDYWALKKQLEKQNAGECKVRYRGLDAIDWHYKIHAERNDEVWFMQGNAADLFLSQTDSLDSDIYMFPKSISEFSETDFTTLCNCFAQKKLKRDELHVMISLRSDDTSLNMDVDRSEKLYCALLENNLESISEPRMYTCYKDPKSGIKKYDNDFQYPDEAIVFLQKLDECCAVRSEGGCTDDCKQFLNRSPILTVGKIRYQIFSFKRKQPV